MYRFILKRLLMLIPVLLGVSFIVYTILSFTPGDPVQMMLGDNYSEESYAAMQEELGLDDPFLVQYGRFIINAVHGDFGTSYSTGNPVAAEIAARLPNTILLSACALLFAILIGIPLGVISATHQYSAVDVITIRHALRNAMIPIVTTVGLQFGFSLGGAVLVETVFSWPGIGRLLVDCIGLKDTPVVVACVLVLATMFTIINLCIDILYAFLDPRIRAQYKTAKR